MILAVRIDESTDGLIDIVKAMEKGATRSDVVRRALALGLNKILDDGSNKNP